MEHSEYNNEDQLTALVDRFVETRDESLRMELIAAFEPYFAKYANLFCSSYTMDLKSNDTLKFLRLFMSLEDRTNTFTIQTAAKKIITHLRMIFKDCTREDIHDEVLAIFLEQLDRYKPMIAKNKRSKERISFAHFIQVNTRYKLAAIIKARQRDALSMASNILEFNDDLLPPEEFRHFSREWNDIDIRWVNGATTGELFKQLTELDRYLLFLKFQEDINKPLSDYALARLTGLDRMYVRRRMIFIKDTLKELVDA